MVYFAIDWWRTNNKEFPVLLFTFLNISWHPDFMPVTMFIFLNMVLCFLKPSPPSPEVGNCYALVFTDVETKTVRHYSKSHDIKE